MYDDSTTYIIHMYCFAFRYSVPKTPFSLPSTVGCAELNSLINGVLHEGMKFSFTASICHTKHTHKGPFT